MRNSFIRTLMTWPSQYVGRLKSLDYSIKRARTNGGGLAKGYPWHNVGSAWIVGAGRCPDFLICICWFWFVPLPVRRYTPSYGCVYVLCRLY